VASGEPSRTVEEEVFSENVIVVRPHPFPRRRSPSRKLAAILLYALLIAGNALILFLFAAAGAGDGIRRFLQAIQVPAEKPVEAETTEQGQFPTGENWDGSDVP